VRQARVVWLRYFGGLSLDEIARTCLVHVNTTARDLRSAEAWLRAWLHAAYAARPPRRKDQALAHPRRAPARAGRSVSAA
jgi:ECF sigma factor